MRACVQRVREAQVTIDGQLCGHIERGLVVLLGIAVDDTLDDARWMTDKIVGLRIFDDDQGKMNLALGDVAGAMLVISQFTLLGDCRKGRRPSFVAAAAPELAETLYRAFVEAVMARGVRVATGQFRQHMLVSLTNDGPVTMLVESRRES
ncbi:MAG TPA: D-aminoacyl-tRNA deacylase [Pirellulales bacterium]|jgi:D-tyrosyl-tRNA(Tyr) deacylase|nr:D-aminoacyl-tRNA deacylase [Pirellulales bacterium]